MSVATRGMSSFANDGEPDAVLIAGPTASGKSALAFKTAEAVQGVIVNADSMQVYDGLHILTARPDEADIRRVPHFLYGHVAVDEAYSVGRWTRDVRRLLDEPALKNRVPVFVGGTGLYFKALLGGLSEMPVIPDAIRIHWRDRLSAEGPEVLHGVLQQSDPAAARRLDPGDSQRIVRALEVVEASGQSIGSFQGRQGTALIDPARARKIVVLPERTVLRKRIHERFERMMDAGAIDEVRALLSRDLASDLPVMKAIGVREIAAYIDGQLSRESAVEKATIATRQYAKRQMTWFRNQLSADWERRDIAT